jgi:hypothetical protein
MIYNSRRTHNMNKNDDEEIQDAKANKQKKNVVNNGEIKLNPVIVKLWEDFRKVVKAHGHGTESKEILVKICDLTPIE